MKLITEGEPKTVRFATERLLEESTPLHKRMAVGGDGSPVRVELNVSSRTDEELAEAMRGWPVNGEVRDVDVALPC